MKIPVLSGIWTRIKTRRNAKTVAVVRLAGAISTGRGLNDQSIAPQMEKAFASKPAAVALAINSPGGSPVQSSLIGARIRRLAEEKEIPVIAFVEDVAASGGYWLAAAADEIWADESSVLGSIGVISAGFGFQDFIAKHGVERRVHTAGESKSMLDPFKAQDDADVARLNKLLEAIHANFKSHITKSRGDKLPEQDLFTGEIWVGQQAIDVGLADGIGHLVPEMKKRFGKDTRFKTFEAKRGLMSKFGFNVVDELTHQIEERAAFARFGL